MPHPPYERSVPFMYTMHFDIDFQKKASFSTALSIVIYCLDSNMLHGAGVHRIFTIRLMLSIFSCVLLAVLAKHFEIYANMY